MSRLVHAVIFGLCLSCLSFSVGCGGSNEVIEQDPADIAQQDAELKKEEEAEAKRAAAENKE